MFIVHSLYDIHKEMRSDSELSKIKQLCFFSFHEDPKKQETEMRYENEKLSALLLDHPSIGRASRQLTNNKNRLV